MATLPTIKIVGKNGMPLIINSQDFREGAHVRWEDRETAQPAEYTAYEIKPLTDFTIKELRVLAKKCGITPGTANKEELVEVIQAHEADQAASAERDGGDA